MATKNSQTQTTQPPLSASHKRPFESLREVIGLIGAGAGILAALFYLAGRNFAEGYFSAMNIPSYQVAFSLWEYGAVAWLPILIYSISMILASSLLGGIFSILADWTLPLRTSLWKWVKRKVSFKLPSFQLPEVSRKTRLWFVIANSAFVALLFFLIVIFTLQFVTQYGSWNGKVYVLESASQVELISGIPMAFDDGELVAGQSGGHDYYVYTGFHLLTFNEGKYYLFREIDPATCRPAKVYVIEANNSLQVNLLPPVSLADKCKGPSAP